MLVRIHVGFPTGRLCRRKLWATFSLHQWYRWPTSLELFQPSRMSLTDRLVLLFLLLLLLLHCYPLLSLLQLLTELAIRSYSTAVLDKCKRYDTHGEAEEPKQTTCPCNPQ